MTDRLSVLINDECAAALRQISQRHGISITETVRRAIAVFKFVEDTIGAGKSILVRDGDVTQELELLNGGNESGDDG